MRPTDPAYSRYARHYDQIGQRRFGESSARDLLRLLALQGDHPASVLDLACGTGAATIIFARQGLEPPDWTSRRPCSTRRSVLPGGRRPRHAGSTGT